VARGLLRVGVSADPLGPVATELARFQWEEGRRALGREADDRVAFRELRRQVELVEAELSRRLGQVFTLADLVRVYGDADRWAPALLHEAFGDAATLRASTAVDTAFELHSRRALDYTP
jgi:hypothetical protein